MIKITKGGIWKDGKADSWTCITVGHLEKDGDCIMTDKVGLYGSLFRY